MVFGMDNPQVTQTPFTQSGTAVDDVVDLSIIEPIPNTGDLADHDIARSISNMAYSLAAGDSPEVLDEFLERTTDADVIQVAANFATWAGEWMADAWGDDQDQVQAFLSETAAELVDQIWPAYDPDNLVSAPDKVDAALSFVGASLFWGFMADAEIVNDDQAHAWSALWFSIIADPYIRRAYAPPPEDTAPAPVQSPIEAQRPPPPPAQQPAQPAPLPPPMPPFPPAPPPRTNSGVLTTDPTVQSHPLEW